ncbi:MAG: radical SAM protein [Vicinamibacterales bacterium]|jgi:radical SAM superfamily enzyme YgiQ (UPF0313 family)|nr:radical SAM protein [Acidobacteriota bacterium]MDP7471312.1 radical SAM protein [Vicinamibacterales bacterium]MDP7672476.1 radical SAM protein [Vicinamibacterales bacterium]HJO37524.1 radical SAM protein [Vicinamibacterales bacterium]
MRVHLVNPSNLSFGTSVITPRWLFVLAGATPAWCGDPTVNDETIEPFDLDTVDAGDVVGIGIHTGNVLKGYEIGRAARAHGATVVFGGIHSTLYPDETRERGGAHAVVCGDGDLAWGQVLDDVRGGRLQPVYQAGRVEAANLAAARWDLMPRDKYMWASVQTVRGCPKHCSFCSVWRTDGQEPRQHSSDVVIEEIVALRRLGYRFLILADDNFYPVTLDNVKTAQRREDPSHAKQLEDLRAERFDLMERMAELPSDMVFFTQLTMEAAEDPEFLAAMKRARIRGALVGVESVTPEGLKAVYKDFNLAGDALVDRLRAFREHGMHVLGSFIFGLPTDRAPVFEATAKLADEAGITMAQFVMLAMLPGTIDFDKWEKQVGDDVQKINGIPLTRYWLIPHGDRPRIVNEHPSMSDEEIRRRTQGVWDRFYRFDAVWRRSRCVKSLKSRLAFVLVSKLYRQMYANTGITTDSARIKQANRVARRMAKWTRRLFVAQPLPDLQVPRSGAQPLPDLQAPRPKEA